MPSASATVSCARMARQARPVRLRSRLRQSSSVSAAAASRMKYQARPSLIAKPPIFGGSIMMPVEKPRLRFVFAAEIDHDEMQRERADREIEPAQPQRRQPEDDAEQRADQRRGRQRDPERRVDFRNRMPTVKAPAASRPAWPSEIWPA